MAAQYPSAAAALQPCLPRGAQAAVQDQHQPGQTGGMAKSLGIQADGTHGHQKIH